MMLAWYFPSRDIVTGILCPGVVLCGAGHGLDDGTLGTPHADFVEDEGRDGAQQHAARGEGHKEKPKTAPVSKLWSPGIP
ncbi:hypothetical protein AHiyo1_46930 [Arthrobacter sp. Hiyo1]|nr:hypothetical protein AHiyo1_46930 [Arthrobacter sp. Hiyo1]